MNLEINSLLRERYRIKQVLAKSGMGTIYLAHDEVLDVDIAIKENSYTTAIHSNQFRREATLLAKLRHPNLPRVINHFVIEDQGEYLVMDYIEGQDLGQRLQSLGKPLSEEEAVRIGAVVSEALIYLHSRNPPVIHRDIKPSNIKITPEGYVVLVDFGLAKTFEEGVLTAAGAQGVTPGYSPVEQYGGGTDPRSDIYALGATLYTLLTNQKPPEALERALGSDDLPTIRSINLEVSEPVQTVIKKAMAVQAEDRFQDAQSFQDTLLQAHPLPDFSPSKPVLPPKQIGTSTQVIPVSQQNPTNQETPKKQSKSIWLLPLILVLVMLCGGGGYILANRFIFTSQVTSTPTQADTVAVAALANTPTPSVTQTVVPPTGTVTQMSPTLTPTVTMTPPPAGTPQGGGQGQIAFVSERGDSPQIYLINVDGSGLEQLTNEPEGACQPAWSPDGLDLAYISPCNGRKDRYENASIFVLHLASGVTELISTLATGDYDPAWSPDGTMLAFTSLQTGKPQIFIHEFASRKSTPLMNRAIVSRMPTWSPDGSQIIFVSPSPIDNSPILMLVDVGGQEQPQGILGPNFKEAYRPAWSPNEDLILFDQGDDSLIGGRILGKNQDVTISTALNFAENLAFSTDANWLVCDGVLDLPGRDIFLMLRTGAHLQRLTEDPSEDYQPAWRP